MNEGLQAQVTRSQVNLQFMRAEMLLRREKYQEALSALDVVIEISPGYPAPYLRKAHIYDDLYKQNGDQEAKKHTISLVGGAIFLVVAVQSLPLFFGAGD